MADWFALALNPLQVYKVGLGTCLSSRFRFFYLNPNLWLDPPSILGQLDVRSYISYSSEAQDPAVVAMGQVLLARLWVDPTFDRAVHMPPDALYELGVGKGSRSKSRGMRSLRRPATHSSAKHQCILI